MKVAKEEIKHRRELIKISEKIGANIGNLRNIVAVQAKVNQSRKEYLQLKVYQEAHRRRYLENTNIVKQWHGKRMKR